MPIVLTQEKFDSLKNNAAQWLIDQIEEQCRSEKAASGQVFASIEQYFSEKKQLRVQFNKGDQSAANFSQLLSLNEVKGVDGNKKPFPHNDPSVSIELIGITKENFETLQTQATLQKEAAKVQEIAPADSAAAGGAGAKKVVVVKKIIKKVVVVKKPAAQKADPEQKDDNAASAAAAPSAVDPDNFDFSKAFGRFDKMILSQNPDESYEANLKKFSEKVGNYFSTCSLHSHNSILSNFGFIPTGNLSAAKVLHVLMLQNRNFFSEETIEEFFHNPSINEKFGSDNSNLKYNAEVKSANLRFISQASAQELITTLKTCGINAGNPIPVTFQHNAQNQTAWVVQISSQSLENIKQQAVQDFTLAQAEAAKKEAEAAEIQRVLEIEKARQEAIAQQKAEEEKERERIAAEEKALQEYWEDSANRILAMINAAKADYEEQKTQEIKEKAAKEHAAKVKLEEEKAAKERAILEAAARAIAITEAKKSAEIAKRIFEEQRANAVFDRIEDGQKLMDIIVMNVLREAWQGAVFKGGNLRAKLDELATKIYEFPNDEPANRQYGKEFLIDEVVHVTLALKQLVEGKEAEACARLMRINPKRRDGIIEFTVDVINSLSPDAQLGQMPFRKFEIEQIESALKTAQPQLNVLKAAEVKMIPAIPAPAIISAKAVPDAPKQPVIAPPKNIAPPIQIEAGRIDKRLVSAAILLIGASRLGANITLDSEMRARFLVATATIDQYRNEEQNPAVFLQNISRAFDCASGHLAKIANNEGALILLAKRDAVFKFDGKVELEDAKVAAAVKSVTASDLENITDDANVNIAAAEKKNQSIAAAAPAKSSIPKTTKAPTPKVAPSAAAASPSLSAAAGGKPSSAPASNSVKEKAKALAAALKPQQH